MAGNLSQFDNELAPSRPQGSQRAGLDMVADGDYDWTVLSGEIRVTPKSGDTIVALEIRCEATGQVVERASFLSSQQNADILAGDLLTLGFDTPNWKASAGRPFSQELPKALAAVAGRRFRGTKKANNSNGKTYHNLYLNSRLPDAVPGQTASPLNGQLATDQTRDVIPF
jgi:hypothetical protein